MLHSRPPWHASFPSPSKPLSPKSYPGPLHAHRSSPSPSERSSGVPSADRGPSVDVTRTRRSGPATRRNLTSNLLLPWPRKDSDYVSLSDISKWPLWTRRGGTAPESTGRVHRRRSYTVTGTRDGGQSRDGGTCRLQFPPCPGSCKPSTSLSDVEASRRVARTGAVVPSRDRRDGKGRYNEGDEEDERVSESSKAGVGGRTGTDTRKE